MATSTFATVAVTPSGVRPVRVSGAPAGRPIASDRALKILAHAIEYLSDEFVSEPGSNGLADPRLEAIALLMNLHRDAFTCAHPERGGWRLGRWLGLRAA